MIAADLQEPPNLLIDFLAVLNNGEADIVVGKRVARNDPWSSQVSSNLFWTFYRKLVMPQMTVGGVDVFGCNGKFRDELLKFSETQTSLVGQIFWLGFRRVEVNYERRPRLIGKSAWSVGKKVSYLLDSIFSFTDLPIRLLLAFGLLGSILALAFGALVFAFWAAGAIEVPGYAPTVLLIVFFGALNLFAVGVAGSYAARTFENTKARPLAVVRSIQQFGYVKKIRLRRKNLAEKESRK